MKPEQTYNLMRWIGIIGIAGILALTGHLFGN